MPNAPPEDDGLRLATFRRHGAEELRVSLNEFEGSRYVGLRVWFRDDDGAWWPTRKGLSIRFRELVGTIRALQRGIDLLSRPRPAAAAAPSPEAPTPARPSADWTEVLGPQQPVHREFNECAGDD